MTQLWVLGTCLVFSKLTTLFLALAQTTAWTWQCLLPWTIIMCMRSSRETPGTKLQDSCGKNLPPSRHWERLPVGGVWRGWVTQALGYLKYICPPHKSLSESTLSSRKRPNEEQGKRGGGGEKMGIILSHGLCYWRKGCFTPCWF